MKKSIFSMMFVFFLAGCAGKSGTHVDGTSSIKEQTTTLGTRTDFSRDQLWSAALESFSLDQKGVRGRLGLVPRRVRVGSEESEIPGLELATNWYEADIETGVIHTRWLTISPADRDRYCTCPRDEAHGMTTTSVKLDVFVKAQEAGSSLDLSSVFQQYRDNPSKPEKGKTTLCRSTGVLEQALSEIILERAGGHQ